ncbi:MAG: putative lipase [Syntrophorhabdaceae bacterium]|nr:putative lipase [Syntrophorhabdaceae bacterium]
MVIPHPNSRTWVIFIHGLGVTEKIWFDPLKEKTNFISFKTLLKDERDVTPLAERLKGGFNIGGFTQSPLSGIDEAAVELKSFLLDIFKDMKNIGESEIVFIAHSRGGLVARRAIQLFDFKPKALICLSTPHYGSGLADFVEGHFHSISFILPFLKPYRKAISELCKTSSLIMEINDPANVERERGIPHFDIVGTSTHYFTVGFDMLKRRVDIIRVLDSIERLFSGTMLPELKRGYGDGFVTIDASRSPATPKENFFLLPVNHANILIDSGMWSILKNIIKVVLNLDNLYP